METVRSYKGMFVMLILLLVVAFILNLSLGSVAIPLSEIFSNLSGGEVTKSSWDYIILDYRLPKAITAVLVGGGLAISGLLMQTLFRNPLAGPFVLGLSSGASLGVAMLILGAGSFASMIATRSAMSQRRSVRPASIAGVTFKA